MEELGSQADPTWAGQIQGSLADGQAIGSGATIPMNTETEWDEVNRAWTVDKHGRQANDRYGPGTDQVNDINDTQLHVSRTLLGTLLPIRRFAGLPTLTVRGELSVDTPQGARAETRVMLCGCGQSCLQPYCDRAGPCGQ
ncbi:hypothetical protein [Streptomyces sp. NPDC058694]|uniref:hypothetical protein n=1 Tax=Streptomyces sp. NPDC058694 TaxID=3346603 RepID=UPI00365BE5CC